jgi:pyruvate formate lyase activating enzyme
MSTGGMESAVVTNIQGYSLHDGPGIRTVVFTKGCPLRCPWCANPENLSADPQMGFIKSLCQNCGRCAAVCPRDAVRLGEDAYRIDRERCDCCGLCASACRFEALVRYGEKMTSAEAFEKTLRDKMFYDTSGGGVTVSGGEPLLYPGFVSELFRSLRDRGVNTCVETCGFVPQSAFEAVLPVTDLFLYDIKLSDSAKHSAHTGAPNGLILENARFLGSRGAKLLFRRPLIPGVNDSEEETRDTAAFLRSLGEGGDRLQLMPYHRMGQSKYDALAMKCEAADVKIPDADAVKNAKRAYAALGLQTI